MAGQSKRILVVDDNSEILDLYGEFLGLHNYDISTAASGERALEIIREEKVDLVMLDIKMPGISGMETLRLIKEYDPNIRVIMLTGYGYQLERTNAAIKYGASAYINKNMSLDEILAAIEDVLRKKARKPQMEVKKEELVGNYVARKRRILIVDDDQEICSMLKERFTNSGSYDVFISNDAQAIEETISSCIPDVILLDIKMPEVDGIEALKRILQFNADIKVVILTGTTYEYEKAKEMLELGAVSYINKTVTFDHMLATVEEIFDKHIRELKPISKNASKEDLVASAQTRILIVDDEKDSCYMIAEYLGMLGYSTESAHSAEEGLERIKNNTFDVVLLDLKMPGMGGVEGCRRMKMVDSSLRIIIVTAVKDEHTLSKMSEMGVSNYLIKPFSFEQLKANILMALMNRG